MRSPLVFVVPLAAIAILLFVLFVGGDGRGSVPADYESRFRAYLHSPAGEFACAYMAMGGGVTPEADDELSPEQVYAIMDEECR